jgi:transmembrane sensor
MTDASPSGAEPLPLQQPETLAEGVRRAALAWQVTLLSGEVTPAEQLAFEEWLAADPVHRDAWQQVLRLSRELHAVPGDIAGSVLRGSTASGRRRTLLRALLLLGGAGTLAYGLRETPYRYAVTAAYRTAPGKRSDLTLPDGSAITLNTDTVVDLRFSEAERRVLLQRGEVLIDTVEDVRARPFVVETGEGTIRALGTRFTVRRLEDRRPAESLVQVFSGAVEIRPRDVGLPLQVAAGRQARFRRDRTGELAPADTAAGAWARGLLVAEGMRLGDFLAELGRYRRGVLRCDPAAADLIVSGVYPLRDTDAILRSLGLALPVDVRMTMPWWVTVHAR